MSVVLERPYLDTINATGFKPGEQFLNVLRTQWNTTHKSNDPNY